jgi:ribosomal protein L40E
MFCEECGAAIPNAASQCLKCGLPATATKLIHEHSIALPAITALQQPINSAFCGMCGEKLPEGAVFCGQCGYRVADAALVKNGSFGKSIKSQWVIAGAIATVILFALIAVILPILGSGFNSSKTVAEKFIKAVFVSGDAHTATQLTDLTGLDQKEVFDKFSSDIMMSKFFYGTAPPHQIIVEEDPDQETTDVSTYYIVKIIFKEGDTESDITETIELIKVNGKWKVKYGSL